MVPSGTAPTAGRHPPAVGSTPADAVFATFATFLMVTPPADDVDEDELQLDERRERTRGPLADDQLVQRASSASRTNACTEDVHDVLDDADELEPWRLPLSTDPARLACGCEDGCAAVRPSSRPPLSPEPARRGELLGRAAAASILSGAPATRPSSSTQPSSSSVASHRGSWRQSRSVTPNLRGCSPSSARALVYGSIKCWNCNAGLK